MKVETPKNKPTILLTGCYLTEDAVEKRWMVSTDIVFDKDMVKVSKVEFLQSCMEEIIKEIRKISQQEAV
jgi:hypothetical protein